MHLQSRTGHPGRLSSAWSDRQSADCHLRTAAGCRCSPVTAIQQSNASISQSNTEGEYQLLQRELTYVYLSAARSSARACRTERLLRARRPWTGHHKSRLWRPDAHMQMHANRSSGHWVHKHKSCIHPCRLMHDRQSLLKEAQTGHDLPAQCETHSLLPPVLMRAFRR